eukprot:EST46802.1 Hypothetical protein SS50377_13167 [Spironucleus salmonicida]
MKKVVKRKSYSILPQLCNIRTSQTTNDILPPHGCPQIKLQIQPIKISKRLPDICSYSLNLSSSAEDTNWLDDVTAFTDDDVFADYQPQKL